MSEERKPPDIGMRIGITTKTNMNVELTAMLSWDEADDWIDKTLDRLIAAAQRQGAITNLPEYEAERDTDTANLLNEELLLVRAGEAFDRETKERETKIAELLRDKSAKELQFSEEWVASGRKGPFKPRGAQDNQLRNFDAQIENIKALQEQRNQEFLKNQSGLANTIEKRRANLAKQDELIADAKRRANGHLANGVGPANDV